MAVLAFYIAAIKRCFTLPSFLARRSALVLKVDVSCVWKMMKCISSYSQGRLCLGDISRVYSSKKRFTCPLLARRSALLLTRWSALVLKVGQVCPTGGK